MTVQELINLLMKVEDKEMDVVIYAVKSSISGLTAISTDIHSARVTTYIDDKEFPFVEIYGYERE